MLVELNIADFAIIDKLSLTFNGGFNVLTGETGAGKSIIIDAVSMLLGGRADTSFVRAEADRARVEGVFRLPEHLQAVINPILEREGLEGDAPDTLVLGREIRSTSRNFCRVNGSTVNLNILEEIAGALVDIHGQSEHLSLLQVRQHQVFLDRYAGLDEQREALTAEVRQLRQVRQELADLRRDAQHLARRLDQLSFQVEEIGAAKLKPGEEAELNIERNRLANAEQLSQFASEAYRLLIEGGDTDQPSAADLVGQAGRAIGNLLKLDPTLQDQQQLADNLNYQLEELAGTLRDYSENIDFDPTRLQEVEERLSLIFSLKRKYGDSIEEIIEFGERAKAELENISHSEERIEELREAEESLRRSIGQMALALSTARREAGETLAQGVVSQLADLGMAKADFAVELKWTDDPNGVYVETDQGEILTLACDERGIDRIEFLIAPNPGEPLKPLVKVASGGETSRVMLALKTVLASADETPTLIFDEIDQGIGGRIGGVVGRKLWDLSHQGQHQVLCVTHLPQIAGYGDTHYHVTKQVSGARTQTGVEVLAGDGRVEELAQMLGTLSQSTRQSAREILNEAASQLAMTVE
ncbi:MAG TPA: DNA repair protein RecN [Anaerolineae bacterium]|nr:DNA repair protein RecN [Anaerolineae bacterium]